MLPNLILKKSVYIYLHNGDKAVVTCKSLLTQLKCVPFCTILKLYISTILNVLYLHMGWFDNLNIIYSIYYNHILYLHCDKGIFKTCLTYSTSSSVPRRAVVMTDSKSPTTSHTVLSYRGQNTVQWMSNYIGKVTFQGLIWIFISSNPFFKDWWVPLSLQVLDTHHRAGTR